MFKHVDKILEDLSYSMASPEAAYIMALIGDKDFVELKRALKTRISVSDIDILITHYKSLSDTNFDLVELSQEAFKSELSEFLALDQADGYGVSSKAQYCIRMGGEVLLASLCTFRGPPTFSVGNQHIEPSKADQIWKAIVRKSA